MQEWLPSIGQWNIFCYKPIFKEEMLGYIFFISITFGQEIIWMKRILATLLSQILYICQLSNFSFKIIDNSLIMDFVTLTMKIYRF